MKKRCKKALALFLSLAVFVSGLVITPPMETKAAFDGAVTSNMDNGGTLLSYYWKGENFDLSCTTSGKVDASTISITDENGADAKSQFTIGTITEADTENKSLKKYTIPVTVNKDAAGGNYVFTISDSNGDSATPKSIYVCDEVFKQINATYAENSFFNSEKQFTETYLYSKVAYDNLTETERANAMKFAIDDSLSADLKIEVSEPDLSTYNGCVMYSVTFIPQRYKITVDGKEYPAIPESESSKKDVELSVSYIDENKSAKSAIVPYTMKQACVSISGLKLIKTSHEDLFSYASVSGNYIIDYPHVDGQTIYIDANEVAYFAAELEGTTLDSVEAVMTNVGTYLVEGVEKQEDEFGFNAKTAQAIFVVNEAFLELCPKLPEIFGYESAEQMIGKKLCVIKMTAAKKATVQPQTFTLNAQSGSTSKTYQLHLYNTYKDASNVPIMNVMDGSSKKEVAKSGFVYDRFNQEFSYKFRLEKVDAKENIIWYTTNTSQASFTGGTPESYNSNNNYLVYKQDLDANMNVKSAGNIIIGAMTAKTLTRPRAAYGVEETLTVNELVLPTEGQFKIKYAGNDMSGDDLKIDEKKTYQVYGTGINEKGDEVASNYPNIVWESSAPSVVTVDNNGNLTAKKQGTARITARTDYPTVYNRENVYTNNVTVNVYSPISALGIVDETGTLWSGKEVDVVEGRTYKLLGDKKAANGESSNENIKWSLADTSVAQLVKADGSYAQANETVEMDECTIVVKQFEQGETDKKKVVVQCTGKESTVTTTTTLVIHPELKAEKVVIDYGTTTIREEVGKTYNVKAKQYYDFETEVESNEELVWESSNPDIVTVTPSQDGMNAILTFKGAGNATITCKTADGKVSDSVTVTGIVKATSITYSYTNSDRVLQIGVPATLTATLSPAQATDQVEWKATPADAVTITEISNGNVEVCANETATVGSLVSIEAIAKDSNKSAKVSFTIKQSINNCEVVLDQQQYNYLANGVTPIETVTYLGTPLYKGTDYTVSLKNHTNAGTATITIAGKGNYTGTKEVTFKILPLDIAQGQIVAINNQPYNGNPITPSVTVNYGTKALKVNTDYTITYVNNVDVGTATVLVRGTGNYTGTLSSTFTIEGKTQFNVKIDSGSTAYYTGAPITPEVTVTDGATVLTKGTDYTVAYSNNVDLGTATVTVTGRGNYSGEKTATFTIRAKTLTEEMVKLSKTDYTYNGKKCKPKLTIKDTESGIKLKENKDYTVTYPTDLVNKGIKKITITGKGNYSGTINVEYGVAEKVTVKKPTIKKAKNSKKKTVAFEVKKVSNAEGYEVYYSTSKKFTEDTTEVLNTTENKTNIKKLKKGKTYYFKVRAYTKNSIGRTIYSSMSKVKKVKIKK